MKEGSDKQVKFYLLAEKENDLPVELFKSFKDISITYTDSVTDEGLSEADIIMVSIVHEKWGRESIRALRTQLPLFLKPLLTFSDQHFGWLNGVVDENIILPTPGNTLNSKIEKLLLISQRMNGLMDISEGEVSERRLKEILLIRFLYTRDNYLLAPVRNINSFCGYTYPLVQLLWNTALGKEIELLEELEKTTLLRGRLLDKIHLCPSCEHFQINFREVCPHCHAIEIKQEMFIHHYRCAYVGRERDFWQGYELVCPKCKKKLRHIGVDYEKPSENVWCNECGSNFSEPLVTCLCLNCNKTFSPEEAYLKQIKEFSLTQEGQRAAEEGIFPDIWFTNILKQEIGFYKFEVFKEFLRQELLRCKRYQYNSTLCLLNIKNFEGCLQKEGGLHRRTLRREFANLLRETFRETDILTQIKDRNLIIKPHTTKNDALIVLKRLEERVNSVLRVRLDFEYNLLDLKTETGDLEDILEKIKTPQSQ